MKVTGVGNVVQLHGFGLRVSAPLSMLNSTVQGFRVVKCFKDSGLGFRGLGLRV